MFSSTDHKPNSSQSRAEAHRQLVSDLQSYADLPANWDFEGSATSSRQAIDDALDFLKALPADVPSPDVGRQGLGFTGNM